MFCRLLPGRGGLLCLPAAPSGLGLPVPRQEKASFRPSKCADFQHEHEHELRESSIQFSGSLAVEDRLLALERIPLSETTD